MYSGILGKAREANLGERKKPVDHFAIWRDLASEPRDCPGSGLPWATMPVQKLFI